MEYRMPETLLEAINYYADPANCESTMIAMRFPNGVNCPRCMSERVTRLSRPGVWKCNGCKRQFSLKVGTIFEDSPLSLSVWFPAVWLLAGAKNGISSCELARALGVTQKTAWFVLHRIRHAMNVGSFDKPMTGTVEADETYIGGKELNKHKSKKTSPGGGYKGKATVMGLMERGGGVRAKVLPNSTGLVIKPEVRKHVAPGTNLITDTHGAYRGLSDEYMHEIVNHAYEYVRGNVHTNSLENFWSLLKRTLKGTYVAVDVPHLDAYLDEQCFSVTTPIRAGS